jgi:hypothetical protein
MIQISRIRGKSYKEGGMMIDVSNPNSVADVVLGGRVEVQKLN